MTKLSDILSTCNIEAIYQPEIGDVFLINLTREEGITPKTRDDTRNKFYIALGFDEYGNAYGGVVINSHVNQNMPMHIQRAHMPLNSYNYSFLSHNSFIDCSKLFVVRKEKLNKESYKGILSEEDLLLAIGTVKESKTINRILLKRVKLIE